VGDGRDLIALLRDLPARGQVGAIVEPPDEATALVEFSDDEGAYVIDPWPHDAFAGLADRAPSRRDTRSGHYCAPDGAIGNKTTVTIVDSQQKNGMAVNGRASQKVLEALRR